MKWHYQRDERGDVVWSSDMHVLDYTTKFQYTIHVTAETCNATPCGWGVKVNSVFAQAEPSRRRSHDRCFNTVRDAKAWCAQHLARHRLGVTT